MPKKGQIFPITIVRWFDAYLMEDVADASKLNAGCLQETYGICVKETDEAISIAHERSLEDGSFRHVTTIPKPYVKEIFRFECKVKNVLPKSNKEEGGSVGKTDLPLSS